MAVLQNRLHRRLSNSLEIRRQAPYLPSNVLCLAGLRYSKTTRLLSAISI